MRASRFSLLLSLPLLACAIAAPACATQPASAGLTLAGRLTTAPLLWSIERTSCYGWCPVYGVFVYADGTVEYEGVHFVMLKGLHRGRVSASQIAALRERFTAAGFAHLQPSYERRDYPDMPSIIIGGPGRDASYVQVRHYLGDTSAPPQLLALEEEFDRLVQTEQWIGTEEQREGMRASW